MMPMVNSIRRVIVWVTIGANVAGALFLLGLTILINTDILSRNLFNEPFRGVTELVVFSMILIVFLQLPDVVRTNRLIRSDGVLTALAAHRPMAGKILSRFIDGVSCIFMCLIVWMVWPQFFEAFGTCHFFSDPEYGLPKTGEFWHDLKVAADRCDYFGTPGILKAPWWPAKLALAFGVTLAAILFAFKTVLGDDAKNGDRRWDQ